MCFFLKTQKNLPKPEVLNYLAQSELLVPIESVRNLLMGSSFLEFSNPYSLTLRIIVQVIVQSQTFLG